VVAKLLGIDIGTSGCKVILIDETGKVLKQASAEYPLSSPQPLWSEQNPEDWWTGVEKCLVEIGEPNPDAIGIAGQMHGAVFLDENDAIIRPAILWNDQRTAEECAEIDATVGKNRMRDITFNPPLTGFQLPKLVWLRNHELSKYSQVRSLLLPKDYIRFRLTGEKVTEVSDASGTSMLDVTSRNWSQEILSALEIDAAILPRVVESDEVTGHTKAVAGLSAGIPVVGGGGDQAAAAVGTGAVSPGIISVSLGTSGVVFTSVEKPIYDATDATHTFCHANRGWHRMGVMLSCGGAVRWLRDTLYADSPFDAVTAAANVVPVGSGGLTFAPYLAGERTPQNDPYLRGAWVGLTLSAGRAEMARAVFEGVTFGLLDGYRALVGDSAADAEVRITGGGAKSPFWAQMIADVFQANCASLETDEGPAFGAAILAGVGVGIWPNVAEACAATVRSRAVTVPSGADYSESYARFSEISAPLQKWCARYRS
jgi:xylulokinase